MDKEIRIKYFGQEPEYKLKKIAVGDWIDLRANMEIVLQQGDETIIPLGVAMELPRGYEAHIVPRSSTFKKWGIIQTNHMGVVDSTYCGDGDEWGMPVMCLRARHLINGRYVSVINKGDRVCQFRIMEIQPNINFKECDVLGNPNRNGFGSTGN